MCFGRRRIYAKKYTYFGAVMIFFNCLSQVSRNVKGMHTMIYYNSAFSVNIRQNEILRQETGYTTKTVEKLCSRTKHKQFP